MTSTKFRTLLVLSIISALAGLAFELIFQVKVPDQVNEQILNLHGQPSELKFFIGTLAGLIAVAMSLVSAVGMYAFKLWAPKIALNSTLLTGLSISLLGAGLSSSPGATLSFASTILWGSVLAISHTSEYVGYAKSAAQKLLSQT